MNKTAKTAMITALTLCAVGMVLSTAGYFAGGKDFNDSSGHVYISGGTDSARKNLEVMEKQQMNAFTKLNVDFQNFDLDIRKSGDDCYYMEYRLEKGGNENPLTWENKGGELTLQETSSGKGSYYISYDLGNLLHHTETQKQEEINTVILYVPQDARFSEARIQLADGDLTAEQFSCKNMTANFLDGDMILDQGKFADGVITLADGDLKTNHSSFSGNLEINNSDGDVFIQMENGNAAKMNIHLKTTDGDVITDNLPQGKSERKEDSSLYENNVDGATSTLNVICRDGDITLIESAKQ